MPDHAAQARLGDAELAFDADSVDKLPENAAAILDASLAVLETLPTWDAAAPRLVFDEIGAQSAATVEALKLLHDAGLLDEDEVLKQFIRVKFKLPKPAPKDDEPQPVTPPGTPPDPDDTQPNPPQEEDQ